MVLQTRNKLTYRRNRCQTSSQSVRDQPLNLSPCPHLVNQEPQDHQCQSHLFKTLNLNKFKRRHSNNNNHLKWCHHQSLNLHLKRWTCHHLSLLNNSSKSNSHLCSSKHPRKVVSSKLKQVVPQDTWSSQRQTRHQDPLYALKFQKLWRQLNHNNSLNNSNLTHHKVAAWTSHQLTKDLHLWIKGLPLWVLPLVIEIHHHQWTKDLPLWLLHLVVVVCVRCVAEHKIRGKNAKIKATYSLLFRHIYW